MIRVRVPIAPVQLRGRLRQLDAMVLAIGELGAKALDGIHFRDGRRRRQFLDAVGGRPGRGRVPRVLRCAVEARFAGFAPARSHDEEYRGEEEARAEA